MKTSRGLRSTVFASGRRVASFIFGGSLISHGEDSIPMALGRNNTGICLSLSRMERQSGILLFRILILIAAYVWWLLRAGRTKPMHGRMTIGVHLKKSQLLVSIGLSGRRT